MSIRTLPQAAPAARIAAESVRTWSQAADRLTPIIGAQGFDVLYKRSLHLTSAAFPWLVQNLDHGQSREAADDAPFSDLERTMQRENPEQAAQASQALFSTFIGLLITLIGERLTTQLMASVRRNGDPAAAPHEAPK